ncbi:coenzyme F420-0:L-glutamate ligase [Methanosarcina sp. KYL-1]|uniref:coenzyme F420-0:L-glutamate ligase n=1 Tax=Methanosarcina sp. KYL-1 TaxID=2602068 RepID=UPI0021014C16|nr:coenzyme F420-0:L-glutamate ligase [Methanosarcina sp. KYL-1]MCQ1536223.1 coenzyme F420-0:L-glutamate ligase [Methanosarcina sp. KYL-1]
MNSEITSIQMFGIKTPIIRAGDDIMQVLEASLKEAGLEPLEGDIFVLAESAVATAEKRIVELASITPGERALILGEKYELDPREMELVLRECDEIFGGVPGAALTITKGILAPNAGIDASNAPEGCVVLLPEDPRKSADDLRKRLEQRHSCRLGVIIGDSRTQPLRLGCTGLALGVSGFVPVEDARGSSDIYGKPLHITHKAVADNLVSAAELLMGEAGERVPCVLIRGAPVKLVDESPEMPTISMEGCMYFGNIIKVQAGNSQTQDRDRS